jgi:aspartate ammonia-lyase
VDGIKADAERCRAYAEGSIGIVTALSPYIGYSKAAEIAKEAIKRGKTVTEVVEERGLLGKEQIKKILDPAGMTEPGISGKK